MKMIQELSKFNNKCGYYTKLVAKIIPEKQNGFAMKVDQEPSKLKNHRFYYTEDREQK